MASVARSILSALRSAINADHSGAGTYDLSGADQVKIGRWFSPPTSSAPFVWLGVADVAGEASGVSLGRYGRVLSVDIMGFVGSDGDNFETRTLDALDLMSDVWAAIEDDVRTVGGTLYGLADVIDVVVQGVAFDGDEEDLAPGFGVFGGSASVSYQTTRGI